jgi:hypothetical protein
MPKTPDRVLINTAAFVTHRKSSVTSADQIVRLSNKRARQAGAYDIRRVESRDPESGKTCVHH